MMKQQRRSVLIVGGGIGGLTAAVALCRRGHAVEVVEQQPGWPAVGWGLSLTGPALRALDTIGLAQPCIDAGYPMRGIRNCDTAGKVLHEIEPPSLLGPGQPVIVGLGRPALSRVLRTAAESAGALLSTGAELVDLTFRADDVRAVLGDGSERIVDLVVGADGVGSRTRSLMGIDGKPSFLGQYVWRTMVERPDWATCTHTFNAPRHASGLTPISPEHAYIFSTQNVAQVSHLSGEALVAEFREVLSPLEGWMAGARDAVEDPDAIVRRPVLGLLVDGPWHRDRAVLIGDAAHTCAPHMISGAALAIEDAVLLAEHLDEPGPLEAALGSFGRRRLPRAKIVVEASSTMSGLEREHRYAEEHVVQEAAFAALANEA